MEVITNNVPRPVLYWDDLTPKEQAEFDYVGNDPYNYSFFRFKGWVYDLGEFMRIPDGVQYDSWRDWHGYQSDTFFSGVLVKVNYREETVIVGRFYT